MCSDELDETNNAVKEPGNTYSALVDTSRDIPHNVTAVAQQIVARFQPERIILFGSHAYGEPHPGSDVDLLVVMETPFKEAEQAARICQRIDYHFGLDLIVRTPATLNRRLALGDLFSREIVDQGIVLYERPHD
ncbi:MAG: nucleotidyltransferase domain-containing protein [Anaerolineae bacterium]|nr:nucleotidyltransferase domain-containing protein [Anaerolineae bacterium]